MTLTDALAESIWKLTHPYPYGGGHHDLDDADELYYSPNELAGTILADPAFREALTAALAEALDATSMEDEEADELREEAAAIVAHLLPVEGVRG